MAEVNESSCSATIYTLMLKHLPQLSFEGCKVRFCAMCVLDVIIDVGAAITMSVPRDRSYHGTCSTIHVSTNKHFAAHGSMAVICCNVFTATEINVLLIADRQERVICRFGIILRFFDFPMHSTTSYFQMTL